MAEKLIKDILMEKTAEELGQPLSTVEAVISWGFRDAFRAFHTYDEVEISGLGKFLISQAKLKKRIKRKEEILAHLLKMSQDVPLTQKKIEDTKATIEYYYSKLKTNENDKEDIQTNSGGLSQPADTTSPSEGTD